MSTVNYPPKCKHVIVTYVLITCWAVLIMTVPLSVCVCVCIVAMRTNCPKEKLLFVISLSIYHQRGVRHTQHYHTYCTFYHTSRVIIFVFLGAAVCYNHHHCVSMNKLLLYTHNLPAIHRALSISYFALSLEVVVISGAARIFATTAECLGASRQGIDG